MVAVYLGAVGPMSRVGDIAQETGAGLAAKSPWEPVSLQRSAPVSVSMQESAGVIGGVPGGVSRHAGSMRLAAMIGTDALSKDLDVSDDRRLVRRGSMDLIVKSPVETSETIRLLAESAGGFLVSSDTFGGGSASSALLTVRIPASKFENVRSAIRKLGLSESEKLEAEDVTKQYVDQAARIRNLRGQEMQYSGILKQARSVKDTVAVSEKLDQVRGEIEQQQAEFDALSKQVETIALTISLRPEAEVQVLGLHWRPLYQLKLAARQGLDSIGEYAAALASFMFYLPTVLLWLATILIGAALGWRLLRWAGRALFMPGPKTA